MGAYEDALRSCMEALEKGRARREAEARQREARASEAATIRRILSDPTPSRAGVSVTPGSAMRTSAVWACVRYLSTLMAAMPLHVLRDVPGSGKEKAIELPVYQLLHRAPNPEQTSFVLRQTAMAHLCLYGNAYAEIEFDNFGRPVALWPIAPWSCEPARTQTGELYYRVTVSRKGDLPTVRDLAAYRVFHVMGLGTDGMKGLSPIRQEMETLGISMAADQFAGLFFGQGLNVGGVVTHPGHLTKDGSTSLRESINATFGGLGRSHRVMLLEEAMSFTKVGIPPNEAQFIETRQFQIEDVARIFGVPLHKIGHLLHATFSNIEHQAIEVVTDTFMPWAVNWEQEIDRKLLAVPLYSKHSLEGLLRGDSAGRATFYRELFYIGSLSPDEIRESEDKNPIPDGSGKRFYVQANMIPSDRVDAYLSMAQSKTVRLAGATRQIAKREAENFQRALARDPKGFGGWLDEFYHDFAGYVERVSGDPDWARSYVEQSRALLALPGLDATVRDWEQRRVAA